MSDAQARDYAVRMDRVEGYALNPHRTGEEHRSMLRIAEELQSCGDADIEGRARRVLAHNHFETALNLLEGAASNTHNKPEDYAGLIPTAEKLLSCGHADIEQRARELIQILTKRQTARPWWQFWK